MAYIFFSLSNADVSLAKELKIECQYESQVNRQKSSQLRNELKFLREHIIGRAA